MNCEQARKLLSPHLDAALADSEREELPTHLKECPSCREHFTGLEQVVSLVRGIPAVSAPADFRAAVLTGLPRRSAAKSRLIRLIPAAAAAVLLISFGYLGALVFLSKPAGRPLEVVGVPSAASGASDLEGAGSSPAPEAGLAIPAPSSTLPPDPAGAIGIGGGAGGAFQIPLGEAQEDKRRTEVPERVLSYVVSGGKPDATAGLILAELQNRRSRDKFLQASFDDGESSTHHERVVADEEGEPARLVLYLTADEVHYILTLLAERNGTTTVSGRRAGDGVAAKAKPPGTPDGAVAADTTTISGSRASAAEGDQDKEEAESAPGEDGTRTAPRRFRVDLQFDR